MVQCFVRGQRGVLCPSRECCGGRGAGGPLVGWTKWLGTQRDSTSPQGEVLRAASSSVNGMTADRERKELLEGLEGKIPFISDTRNMKGCGVVECVEGNECVMWEGRKGGVVWCGAVDNSRGTGKEGCVLLLSPSLGYGMAWSSAGHTTCLEYCVMHHFL